MSKEICLPGGSDDYIIRADGSIKSLESAEPGTGIVTPAEPNCLTAVVREAMRQAFINEYFHRLDVGKNIPSTPRVDLVISGCLEY